MNQLNKLTAKTIWLWPFIIVLGIFDYRFSQTLFPNLSNKIQIFHQGFFDHTSILTIFSLLITTLLIANIIKDKNYQKTLHSNIKKTFPFLICIAIGLITTYIFTDQLSPIIRSKYQVIGLHWLMPLISVFLSISFIQTHNQQSKFTQSLKISTVIFSLLTLFQYITQALPGVTTNHLNRFSWPYIDPFYLDKAASPNLLAYIFAPILIFSFLQTYKKTTILNATNLILSSIILLLTQSYTAILSVLLVIFIYFFKQANNKNKLKISAASITILIALIISQYNTPKFQILLGNTKTSNSINERIKIYQVSSKLIQQNPIQGLGINSYQQKFKNIQSEILDNPLIEREVPPHPHNLLIHIWNEISIFGFIGFTYIYILLAINILNFNQKETQITTLLLAYFCIHGLIDVPFFLEEHSYILFSIILLFLINRHSQKTISSN